MRPFPRAERRAPRRALAAASLLAMMTAGLTAPAAQADPSDTLKDRHSRVEKKQKQAHHDLQRSSQALRRANKALRTARHRLWDARGDLRRVERRLGTAQADHRRIERQLKDKRADLAEARDDLRIGGQEVTDERAELRDLILDSYQSGDPRLIGLAGMVTGEASLTDLTRQASYDDAVETSESDHVQRLEAEKVLLKVRKDNVAEITDAVAEKEDEAKEKVRQIADLRREKTTRRNRVRDLVDHRRKAQQKASRIKARDKRQLKRLRREETKLRKLILASAGTSNRRVGRLGHLLDAPISPAQVTSPFGYRRHPIYHYWGLHNGTDFSTGCGTPLKAVGAGKVISTYYSGVYGRRLYLALGRVNGHGYTAVYNHLSRWGVRRGSVVGPGRVIGYSGSSGWSTGCHLHFTLLRDGKPVNPMNYM